MMKGITHKGLKFGDSIRNAMPIVAVGALFFVGAGISGCGDWLGGASGPPALATGTVNVVTILPETEDEVSGASILVDSAPTSSVSPGTLVLAAGSHTISAILAGYTATPVTVTVTEGATTDKAVVLTPKLVGLAVHQGRLYPGAAQFSLTYERILTKDVELVVDAAVAGGGLMGKATVSDVLNEAIGNGRTLSWKDEDACKAPKKVIAALDKTVRMGAWCWPSIEQEHNKTLAQSAWVPQGITSSDDAAADGTYDSRNVVLVSWYGKNAVSDKGLRISFFERPLTEKNVQYKHVLLARPVVSNGKLDLEPILYDGPKFDPAEHDAGGVAWFGDLLYLTAGNKGFHIFDLRRIYRVYDTEESDVLGRRTPDDGRLYGADYDFVMLEVARASQAGNCTRSPQNEEDGICFAGLSLDRSNSPAALVTAEYRSSDEMTKSKVGVRIVRWNLASSGELDMTENQVSSDGTFLTPTRRVQGVVMNKNEFYFSTTGNEARYYYNCYEKVGDGLNPVYKTWPQGSEAISYWASMDRLWSLTERTSKEEGEGRMVFWVYPNEMTTRCAGSV